MIKSMYRIPSNSSTWTYLIKLNCSKEADMRSRIQPSPIRIKVTRASLRTAKSATAKQKHTNSFVCIFTIFSSSSHSFSMTYNKRMNSSKCSINIKITYPKLIFSTSIFNTNIKFRNSYPNIAITSIKRRNKTIFKRFSQPVGLRK